MLREVGRVLMQVVRADDEVFGSGRGIRPSSPQAPRRLPHGSRTASAAPCRAAPRPLRRRSRPGSRTFPAFASSAETLRRKPTSLSTPRSSRERTACRSSAERTSDLPAKETADAPALAGAPGSPSVAFGYSSSTTTQRCESFAHDLRGRRHRRRRGGFRRGGEGEDRGRAPGRRRTRRGDARHGRPDLRKQQKPIPSPPASASSS